jgi:hypothetical protein
MPPLPGKQLKHVGADKLPVGHFSQAEQILGVTPRPARLWEGCRGFTGDASKYLWQEASLLPYQFYAPVAGPAF